MNTAYLLLAHTQPNQLALLIKTLAHPGNYFFIHIDAKADLESFKKVVNLEVPHQPVIFLSERETCQWGRFSLVTATLRLLRTACTHHSLNFDHFVLLSGQDYPLKSAEHISSFLERYKGHDFIEHYALPSENLRERQGGLYRINRYHYFSKDKHKEFPPYSKKPVLNPLFNSFANSYHKFFRKMPLNMKLYAGSQWWILCKKTACELLHFLDNNPQVECFFQNTWIPDEIFFQTIVKHIATRETIIINYNYRVILWPKQDRKGFVLSPKILTEADWNHVKNSEALFARKFHEEKSRSLIEKLNQHIPRQATEIQ